MVRRRPGTLLELEVDLLRVAIESQRSGPEAVYGYALAKALAGGDAAKRMIGHGTLYKALGRLTEAGLLESWWEDPATAAEQARPRRRLYRVTADGERAWSAAVDAAVDAVNRGAAEGGRTRAPRRVGPVPT